MEDSPNFLEVHDAIKQLDTDKKLGKTYRCFAKNKKLTCAMFNLIKLIWQEERLPVLWWKRALMSRIAQKKRNKRQIFKCHSFISILNVSYKILAKILLKRITPFFRQVFGNTKYNTKAMEQIFILRQVLERSWEYNLPLYQLYLNYDKSYRTIDQELLNPVLKYFGLPRKLINLIELAVRKIHYRLGENADLTINFLRYQGLRERDTLSPLILDVMGQYAIRQLKIETNYLFKDDIQLLNYENEIALLSPSYEIVIQYAQILDYNLKNIGLMINEKKSKFVITCRGTKRQKLSIGHFVQVNTLKIPVVNSAKFLGTVVTKTNDILTEVKCRLTEAIKLFESIKEFLLTPNEILEMYKKVIRPLAMYGSQAWTLTNRCVHLLRGFEENMFRRMLKITSDQLCLCCDHLVSDIMNEPDIILVIRRGRLQWLGHVIRSVNITSKNLLSKPKHKRLKGRPRLRWRDCVIRDLFKIKKKNWKNSIIDKKKWRKLLKETVFI